MKYFFTLIFLVTSLTTFAKDSRPTVWGKIFKAKEQVYGYKYFVYFKKDGKAYAYPLSNKSNIDPAQLDKLDGKYAKIYGSTNFEAINLDSTKHIMTFVVSDARELKLADLNTNFDAYKERMDVNFLKKKMLNDDRPTKKGLSDKAVNAAIFVGGAVLAAEVLGALLSN